MPTLVKQIQHLYVNVENVDVLHMSEGLPKQVL